MDQSSIANPIHSDVDLSFHLAAIGEIGLNPSAEDQNGHPYVREGLQNPVVPDRRMIKLADETDYLCR
jgi:hypothetical protein